MEHTGCTPEGQIITAEDWQRVLNTMNRYKRSSGYVAHDEAGGFIFFDSNPSFGGLYVTKEDVESYAKQNLIESND